MKLKYLLPVATVASVATTIAPFVSCSESESETWDASWDYKSKGKFNSDIEPLEGTSMSAVDATNTYYDALAENKRILCDDYLEMFNDIILIAGATTKSGSVKIKINDSQKTNKSISLKINIDIYVSLGSEKSILKGTIDLASIPFEIVGKNGTAIGWTKLLDDNVKTVGDMLTILKDYEGWKIVSDFYKEPPGEEGKAVKINFDDTHKPTTEDFENVKMTLNILDGLPSHYLRFVTIS